MAECVVKIRVDEKLRDEASEIYGRLGMDLSTAVQIFFRRSVAERGIPFAMSLGSDGGGGAAE